MAGCPKCALSKPGIPSPAATGAVNPLGYNNVIEIGNPQTGGTSGGPWIIGLNPLNGSVPAPSNNSTGGKLRKRAELVQVDEPKSPIFHKWSGV